MEKNSEILMIFILPIFGNYDFKSFEYSKKKIYETKKRISMKLNFVDFNIYGFKILKNLNILNIVK